MFAIAATSSGANARFPRSPCPSAYGFSPITTTPTVAPAPPEPSAEYVTWLFGAAFRIAASTVVLLLVTSPLFPCQSIVQPPH